MFTANIPMGFTTTDLGLLVSSFSALVILHQFITFRYPEAKQNSWIITTIASAVMTVCSLPFVWDFIVGSLESQWGWRFWKDAGEGLKGVEMRTTLALAANRFFQSYLLADLIAGSIYYRSQIHLLTGWMHHIIYVGIVEFAIRQEWPHIFCLAAFMEFPTFILGLSILVPRTRSNVLFALAFFLTRILFHVVLAISYALPDVRQHATRGSFAITGILLSVLPLHVSWFVGCLKGFVRRAKKARDAKLSQALANSTQANTVEVNLKVYNATNETPDTPTPTSTRKALAAIRNPIFAPPGHVYPHPAAYAAQHYYHRLRTRLNRWRGPNPDAQRHGQHGHQEGIAAQLYSLRGGSLNEYRARIGEYRRRVVRQYREYRVEAVTRETKEKVFDWVGLGAAQVHRRRARQQAVN
ncbi:hypothetical protein V5O48_016953 [Marasmius crinis-equi]|uniref:TLC domain-containing protein n=1 Tax=Marasmius crinis-equi TaxID=585013 RepID=A0ABR3EQH6_9AGAR